MRLALLLAALALPAPPSTSTPPPNSSLEYRVSPERRQKALDYARIKYALYFASTFWTIFALALLIRFRIATILRRWAESLARNRFLQCCVFVPLFAIILGLITLPIESISHHYSLKYEESIQSWLSWSRDLLVAGALATALAIPVAWIFLRVARWSPRRWWLWFWLAAAPIVIFLQFVAPVAIEPLFFKFKPLTDVNAPLAAELQKVAARGGLDVPPSRMFEMEASEKLKSVNAYVNGFGASKRVVVWDTTIAKMTTSEIMFVFGHELGHYVLGHVVRGLAFALALLLVSLALVHRAARWLVEKRGSSWGLRGVDDLAALPLLLVLLATVDFFATPIGSAYARRMEHQADAFGLEAIRGLVDDPGETAARAFERLGDIDLSDPDPPKLVAFWLYDHPPIAERVRFARGRR